MTIKNLTKEEMILYQVLAVVEDPPAVASFSIKSKAREQISYHTPIERYIEEDGVYCSYCHMSREDHYLRRHPRHTVRS